MDATAITPAAAASASPGSPASTVASGSFSEAQVQELLRTNDELKQLNARLSEAQEKLMQPEKLASIGRLVAGVGHQINNPSGARCQ